MIASVGMPPEAGWYGAVVCVLWAWLLLSLGAILGIVLARITPR